MPLQPKLLASGIGVATNLERARKWLGKTAAAGNVQARDWLRKLVH